MPGITTGVSTIQPCFPEAGAGGGGSTTYDVSPPAATTEATAAGVALSAHTFGSFTGADAGSIDGYTARTVNAVGSTSWSGTGLGAYTPSGGADGDAGVLALDATIGGVVVATALHDYSRAAAGGGSSWTSVMDWSSSSETFAAGEGAYTIGGLSVTLSYQGSAGPSSIDLSSGVLTIAADATDFAYLVIDLGEDFQNVPLWACVSADGVSGLPGVGAIFWQMADDTTTGNAAGHWQEIIGSGGSSTAMLGRYATGSSTFVTANNRTVTNITTTPTRAAVYIDGTDFRPSFDQGTAALPADGTDLGTVGPKSYTSNSGAYTTTSARNQRYMHLQIKCNATIRMAAAKRS
jgi:hypothetical protein